MKESIKIHIAPETKISEIKKTFNENFDHLKLEFFSVEHGVNEGSHKDNMIQEDLSYQQISDSAQTISLDLHANMPVKTLESLFEEKCHLHVQVFRQSGKIWLETIQSDDWTLEEQNNRAKEMSFNN